jgi:uncharacterized protein DUF3987
MAAMIFKVPLHWRHCSTSILNTRILARGLDRARRRCCCPSSAPPWLGCVPWQSASTSGGADPARVYRLTEDPVRLTRTIIRACRSITPTRGKYWCAATPAAIVALQVQEATLRNFFHRSGGLARGTGFLARFLVAWPESTQGFRPFSEPPMAWPALSVFHRRIPEILANPVPMDEEGVLSPAVLTLAPHAKAAWVTFHDAIEGELPNGGELYDVRDVASKSADNAVRLAALFHVFEHGMDGAVGLEAFEGASRIAAPERIAALLRRACPAGRTD